MVAESPCTPASSTACGSSADVPDRTVLHWSPILPRDQPRGALDVTWRWRVSAGRAKDNDVVLNHPSIPLRHAQFTRLQNTWFVGNIDGGQVYVRGKRVSLEPVRGDDVDFAMLVRFRFELQPMPEEEARLRAAIAAAPFDDARYLVYADWLLERDDALGRQMVSQAPIAARWLGPLHAEGNTVQWRHGFFGRLTVRSAANVMLKSMVFMEAMVHPLSAYLTTLEVDAVRLAQETPECASDHWVDYLFEALLAEPPKALRHLKIRLPVEQSLRFRGELEAVQRKVPTLETPFEQLFTEGSFA